MPCWRKLIFPRRMQLTWIMILMRGAAIVTVRAGARNAEARTLLEKWGARIVHGRHNS